MALSTICPASSGRRWSRSPRWSMELVSWSAPSTVPPIAGGNEPLLFCASGPDPGCALARSRLASAPGTPKKNPNFCVLTLIF